MSSYSYTDAQLRAGRVQQQENYTMIDFNNDNDIGIKKSNFKFSYLRWGEGWRVGRGEGGGNNAVLWANQNVSSAA